MEMMINKQLPMLDQLANPDLDSSDYQVIKNERGQTAEVIINEDLTILLATGYSVQFRYVWYLYKSLRS